MKAQIIVGARARAQALFAWIMCVCVFAKTSQKLPKRTINRARDIDSYSNNVHDEWYQPHRFDPKLNMWQKNTQTKRRRRGREWKIYNKKSSQQLLMFLIHISMQVRNFANWQISFDDCCCCWWWCCCCLFACCTQFHNELITDKIQHTVDCYWYLGGMHFIHKNRSDAFFSAVLSILPWNWYGLINEWKHIRNVRSSLEFLYFYALREIWFGRKLNTSTTLLTKEKSPN